MCEEKASQEHAKLGGSFWEGGVEAVESGVQDTPPEQDEGDWETEVSATLDNLKGVAVLEGYVAVRFSSLFIYIDYCVMKSPRADHPFHVSQLFIILDRTDLLLDVFATGLEDGTYPRSSVELASFSSSSQQQKKILINNLKNIPDTLACADSLRTFVFSSK